MLALADLMMRAEQDGALRFFLIGGRSLEAHGVVRFTKDVDFLVATEDIPAMGAVLTTAGYRKSDENAVFSRWKHPSLSVDDVDVMYVSAATFGKLMEGAVTLRMAGVRLRVPSMPSLVALKLHAIKSNPDRLEKDGQDISDLLKRNPDALDKISLEALFAKYGCSLHFPRFSHLLK